jgi:CheY-like chemotaxis protein
MANPARSNTPAAAPNNTIRMAGSDLQKLQAELDLNSRNEPSHKRSHHRWPFRHASVKIEVEHPGGATSTLNYACRNISAGGISVLHSSFMHLGTKVIVFVPLPGGKTMPIPGVVARCRHYRGNVHEIGLRFTKAIEIREVLDLDPMAGRFTLEHVNPESLRGTLLHVEDSVMDRRLVRYFLKETSLNVIAVESPAEAMNRIGEGFDLILCDFSLPGMNGADFCLQLRAADVRTPLIMASADSGAETQGLVRSCQANAFLLKPFTREQLLRGIAEFLLVARATSDRSGMLYSTLSPDDPHHPLVKDFVDEVHKLAKDVRAALEKNDQELVLRLMLQVKSSAAPMGFERLAQAADGGIQALRGKSGTDPKSAVRQFASACDRAATSGRPAPRSDAA